MSKPQQLVIPGPDEFGFRVNARTPLAHVAAVLRRHNPRAEFLQIKRAAEELRAGRFTPTVPASAIPPGDAGTDVQGLQPDRSDSGTDSGAPAAPESAVGGPPPGPDDAAAEFDARPDPSRAEVARWVAEQRGRAKGLEMNKSGRVPKHILSAYREEHREAHLASLVPVVNSDGSPAEPIPADVPPGDDI